MSLRTSIVPVAVVLGFVAGQARGGQPQTDLYGDPLPEGAVLRLGTARLKSSASQMLFTPDGRTLITLENGRCVKHWNAADGTLRQTFTLTRPCVFPAALSPDGSRFAGGKDQQNIAVWDVASGPLVCEVPSGVCNFAAFSPDGATLATGAWENRLRFWDARTGQERPSPDSKYKVFQAVFSPDGSRFAWSEQGAVICMDVTTGKEAWRKEIRAAQVACSPDGGVLAVRAWPNKGKNENVTETDPCEIRFLNMADGKTAGLDPMPCPGMVVALGYGPDGATLAWRGTGVIVINDLKTGKERRRLRVPDVGWRDQAFAFAPDGKTLTALAGRTLHRWDLSTGKNLYTDVSRRGHNGDVQAVAWSADGKYIATMSQSFETGLFLWDAATGRLLRRLPAPKQERLPPRCWLAFTPDGRLLTAGDDNVVHCWDSSTGKEIWSGTAPVSDKDKTPLSLERLHLTADGKRLIGVSPQQTGIVNVAEKVEWNAATGELIHRTTVSPMSLTDAFSPDGRRRIVWTGQMFDERTGAACPTLEAAHSLSTLGWSDIGDFSPDGAFFAAMLQDWDGNVPPPRIVCHGLQLWETATGKRLTLIPDHECGRLVFSPNGRTVAVVGQDALRAWDMVSGEEVYRKAIPSQAADTFRGAIAFSPDGRRLAVACTDTTALVFDLSAAMRRDRIAAPWTAANRETLWSDLADADAAKAYAAIDRLAARPDDAAALLRDRLRPAVGVSKDRVHRLIAALDDDDFDAREAASRQLADIAERIEPSLRNALGRDNLTPEQRSRIGRALASVPAAPPTEMLRGLRAVRALAWAGTPDARAVLEKLAAGAADDPLTREARAALDRWTKEK